MAMEGNIKCRIYTFWHHISVHDDMSTLIDDNIWYFRSTEHNVLRQDMALTDKMLAFNRVNECIYDVQCLS